MCGGATPELRKWSASRPRPGSDPKKLEKVSTMTWAKLLALILSGATLAGCAGRIDQCSAFKPIRTSQKDILTTGTLGQIVAHNEAGAALCQWRP